jgi:chaperonin cofactor prefoldin
MARPDSTDRKKLIRDLSQLSKILDQRVKTLEDQLEKCQTIVESLKRKLRGHNDDNA